MRSVQLPEAGRRRLALPLLAIALLIGACTSSTTTAEIAAEPTVEPTAPPAPTATVAPSPAPTATARAATPTPEPALPPLAEVRPFEVASFEVELIDTSRPTAGRGGNEPAAERIVSTLVVHPAGPDTEDRRFPLIVFGHGLGGRPEVALALIERWVADGFVVAAPRFPLSSSDAPGGPDAGDVQNQTGDVSFVIDEFIAATAPELADLAPMVDTERIGVAGHSNGAITTLGVVAHECCLDPRVDAAIETAGTAGTFPGGDYDWASGPPLLVVHGTDDALVHVREGVRVFEAAAAPKAFLLSNGGTHGSWFSPRSPDHEPVAAATTDWWRTWLLADPTEAAAASERLTAIAAVEHGDPEATPTWLLFEPTDDAATVPDAWRERLAVDDPAAGARSVTFEPDGPFADGDSITVSWDGFIEGGTINVVQCAGGGVAGPGACDLIVGHILHPNPNGRGKLSLEVIVGPVGTGDCSAGVTDCVVLVNDSGLSEPDATVLFPIELTD